MRLLLRAASIPYGWGVRFRNQCYDRGRREVDRVPVPVVCVGNLTVGGTGKTPCVEYIARHYRQRDLRVAILSRGYGSEVGPNDEAMVLEENLPDVPHLQGADRVALARTAIDELESEILILDDGFQHRRLARDLDVVLIDATNPWGFGYLLPRGMLREPRESLRRAGVILLTRCDLPPESALEQIRTDIRRIAPSIPVAESEHRPEAWVRANGTREDLAAIQGPVAAFCGIGNPVAFRQTLERMGLEVMDLKIYPDHHPYVRADIDELRAWANRLPPRAVVVTTQKDLVKVRLAELGDRNLFALKIGLNVTRGKEVLEDHLNKVIPTES